jgi:uncharacterized Fe-S center protein
MSVVFHAPARPHNGQGAIQLLQRLLKAVDLAAHVAPRDLVALKLHWGEAGNTAYLRPTYARTVADAVREAGGRPFVTDTNVLYRGARHDAFDNLGSAARNGFTAESMGCPVLVADGLKGHDHVDVPTPFSRYFDVAQVASAIHHADALVVLTHVKGHLLFGFGGTLKNLGMGCATSAGKHVLHADVKPKVTPALCTACRRCHRICPSDAITYVEGAGAKGAKKVALIDETKCIGCGECVTVCPDEAIPIAWNTAQTPLLEKTAEYAWAAVANKAGKAVYVSLLTDIVPDCDCFDFSDVPVLPDLGILASTDPVALDQAALDLMLKAPVRPGSALADKAKTGDHFKDLHGHDYVELLSHAEAIGLGSRAYDLREI